jgi:hypothetical protein
MTNEPTQSLFDAALTTLRDVRDELRLISTPEETQALYQRVEQAVVEFEQVHAHLRDVRATAEQLTRLHALAPRVERFNREWNALLASMGVEVARARLADRDMVAGWRRRWGPLTPHALQERELFALRAEKGLRRISTGRPGEWRVGSPVVRGSRVNPEGVQLMLDLRYVCEDTFADIGELFNVAAATVQWRVANFENAVLVAFASAQIGTQVPEGWRQVHGNIQGTSLLRLKDPENHPDIAVRAIRVEVIPVWGTLAEPEAGRPRTAGEARIVGAVRVPRIWALAFADKQRVVFVPETLLRPEGEPSELTAARIIEVANKRGLDSLTAAVQQIISPPQGGGLERGGTPARTA